MNLQEKFINRTNLRDALNFMESKIPAVAQMDTEKRKVIAQSIKNNMTHYYNQLNVSNINQAQLPQYVEKLKMASIKKTIEDLKAGSLKLAPRAEDGRSVGNNRSVSQLVNERNNINKPNNPFGADFGGSPYAGFDGAGSGFGGASSGASLDSAFQTLSGAGGPSFQGNPYDHSAGIQSGGKIRGDPSEYLNMLKEQRDRDLNPHQQRPETPIFAFPTDPEEYQAQLRRKQEAKQMQMQQQMMVQNGQAVGFNQNMFSNGNDLNGIGTALTGGFGLKDSITNGTTAGAGAYDAGNQHQQVGNYSDTVTGGINPNNYDISTPISQRLKQASAERGMMSGVGVSTPMGQMGQMPQMGQMNQMPQMNQMNQMGQMGQMPQMNQMNQMPQMNQMGQMGQMGQSREHFAQPQMGQMNTNTLPPPLQQIQQTHIGQVYQNQIQQQLQQQVTQQLQQQQRAYQEQINQLQMQLQQLNNQQYNNVKPVLKHNNTPSHGMQEDPEMTQMKNDLKMAAKEIIEKTEKNDKQFQLLKAYENYLWKEYRKLNDQIEYYDSMVKQVNINYNVVMNGLKQFGHLIERQDKVVTITGQNGHIVYTFDSPIQNISQIKLIHTNVQNEYHNITELNNLLIYDIHTDEGVQRKQIEIESEFYTIDELIETINPALDDIQIEHNTITNKVSVYSVNNNYKLSLVFVENSTWNTLGFVDNNTIATKIIASQPCKMEIKPVYKLFFSEMFSNHILEFQHGHTLHNQLIELEQPIMRLNKLTIHITDGINFIPYPCELKIQFIQSKGFDYMESMREFSVVKEIKNVLPLNEFEKKAVLESNFVSQPAITMPESITGRRVKFDETVVDNAKPPAQPEIPEPEPEYEQQMDQTQQIQQPTSRNYYGIDLSHMDPVVIQHGISLGYIAE